MLIFDAHCDTLSKIKSSSQLYSNQRQWDIQRASKYGCFIQVLTCFADDPFRDAPKEHMLAQFQLGLEIEKQHPDQIRFIRTKKELEQIRQGYVYGILGAEGAEILGGSLKELDRLFGLGLRIITLAWNYDNEVCDSVAGLGKNQGLSPFGAMVIERMEALGMVIDLSHASDKTFEDVLNKATKPVTASHSNARALCPHRRNLTDSQIQAIGARKGVIGINFYPPFLSEAGNADLLSIIKHIEHMAGLVGTKAIGLGCDFDGMDHLPRGIRGVESLEKVLEALQRLNYSQEDMENIAGRNYLRLFTQILN